VLLYPPAAGSIFIALGEVDKVVGVTRSNTDFPKALQVGSHIKPNLELMKGLQPDLLVISSNRFFSDQMAAQLGAKVVRYDPTCLDEILSAINELGYLLGKPQQAEALVARLQAVRAQIKPLKQTPKVVFEVTESPLMVAGQSSIVSAMVTAAGGELIGPEGRKIAKFNLESILMAQPDYYLYQVGPMNQTPTAPNQRPTYNLLKSHVIQVDQLEYSRATPRSFELALELNRQFLAQAQ
jgi:iron complex transport system substrate-binding protein